MSRYSIEDEVRWIFRYACIGPNYTPLVQDMMLLWINERRTNRGLPAISRASFGVALNRLRRKGVLTRLRWFNPSDGNIWLITIGDAK